MNKDQLQTIKNLIEQRSLVGHFPEDLEVQYDFHSIICKKILQLLNENNFSVINSIRYINTADTFTFKNHNIILEQYQDYLRALEMVLEDTPEDSIAECYLERHEDPNYNHVDTSILLEPIEVKPTIEYVEGNNIAYFQEVDEDDIKRIEQHVLELLEEEIQK